jgi:hypothetical protein
MDKQIAEDPSIILLVLDHQNSFSHAFPTWDIEEKRRNRQAGPARRAYWITSSAVANSVSGTVWFGSDFGASDTCTSDWLARLIREYLLLIVRCVREG